MSLLIKSGRVVDPKNNIDEICDILVKDERIARVAKNINPGSSVVIDAQDKIVMPGLVDMHVHLREPGREDKETVYSATRAALKGGVTSVLAMANTSPVIDCPQNIKLLKEIINKSAQTNVFIAAAISRERKGKELVDIAALEKEGAIAISDDGASVDDAGLLSEALKKARQQKVLVICHCEDGTLSNNGVVNLGFTSTRLGLRGIPSESEFKRVRRDIGLAEKTKARLHIAHVSCQESVDIISQAKKKGIKVTAETAPHYFSLSEEALLDYDTNMKTNPPLRSQADVEAIKKGLKTGAIDAIASDHAPHTENEKEIEFERAEFGVIGLETELSVSIAELVGGGILSWPELVRKLSLNPAEILGIDKGTLGVGRDADIVIVCADKEWIVNKDNIVSKSKNSSFLGRRLKGVVEYTICAGRVVYKK